MITTMTRADSIIPGEFIDMKTVIGYFSEVESVRYIEMPTGREDRVEIKTKGDAISNTIECRASRLFDVISN